MASGILSEIDVNGCKSYGESGVLNRFSTGSESSQTLSFFWREILDKRLLAVNMSVMYVVKDIARIELGPLPVGDLQIVLSGVRVSAHSYFVQCFLNLPRARERTADEKDPTWISTQSMFGSGPRNLELPESSYLTWYIDIKAEKMAQFASLDQNEGKVNQGESNFLTLKIIGVDNALKDEASLVFDSLSINSLN